MKLDNTQVFGFESALRGMRNPMNSWGLSDTTTVDCLQHEYNMDDITPLMPYITKEGVLIGEKDLRLAQTLIKAGTEHCKFMRQIQVWVDITAPRYWWQEFDTYKVGTSANSTSTMHKLFNKKDEINIDLFEVHEEREIRFIKDHVIPELKELREEFIKATTQLEKDKMLTSAKRILSEGYLNTRTVNLSYAVIRNMYLQRKHHRLVLEWQDGFCEWVKSLPYAKELILCGIE